MFQSQKEIESHFGPSPTEGDSAPQYPIPSRLAQYCYKLDLDPRMGVEEIDRKAQEVTFQIGNLNTLAEDLSEAYFNNQIDSDQYNTQDSQLKEYLKKLDETLKVLRSLRECYTGPI